MTDCPGTDSPCPAGGSATGEAGRNYDVLSDVEKQEGLERRYDESAKNFFRKKVIMSRILKYFVPEFSGLDFEGIQECFPEDGSEDGKVNIATENAQSAPVGGKSS